jgi:hypothetical protein
MRSARQDLCKSPKLNFSWQCHIGLRVDLQRAEDRVQLFQSGGPA